MATFLVAETTLNANGIQCTTGTFANLRVGTGTLSTNLGSGDIGYNSGTPRVGQRFYEFNLATVYGTAVSAAALYTLVDTDSTVGDQLRWWTFDHGGSITTADFVSGASMAAMTEWGVITTANLVGLLYCAVAMTASNMASACVLGSPLRGVASTGFIEDNTSTSSFAVGKSTAYGSDGGPHFAAITVDGTPQSKTLAYGGHGTEKSVMPVASGNITGIDPPMAQQGDLLVCVVCYRSNAAFTKPASWADAITAQNSGDAVADTGIGSLRIDYIIRGSSAPALTWTRVAGDVAWCIIIVFRPPPGHTPTLGVNSSATLAVAGVTPSTGTVTTTRDGSLLVYGVSPGDNSSSSAYAAATDPLAASWIEIRDDGTVSGADSNLTAAFAYKATAGATGAITCTNASSTRAASGVAAFDALGKSLPGMIDNNSQMGMAMRAIMAR